LEADADSFAGLAGGDAVFAVFLQHQGCGAEFEPAPAEFAFVDPFVGHAETEAVDVEAEGGFEVRHHEEGDGLLDVGGGFDLVLNHGSNPQVKWLANERNGEWLLKNSISQNWSKKLCVRKPNKPLSWFS
jgi:hypothetical protein